VHLADAARQASAAIAINVGNMAYEWKVGADSLLYFPFDSPAALRRRPTLCGIPLLAPWANRLDEDGFWANGKRYALNPSLGNVNRDGKQKPMHGLLNYSPKWELAETGADDHSAWSRARLQFWKHPEMMAQFPFAHTLTITYRLHDGALSVETGIENHSTDPMPVSLGFHPYFHALGARDTWKVHLPVREHWKLNEFNIPTGEIDAIPSFDIELAGHQYDDVYAGLSRDASGIANCWIEGGGRKLNVAMGPKFNTSVLYAPPGRQFVCIEPMAAVTNGMNLAHAGKYSLLQSIAPGGQWSETFTCSLI
jgi:aldose 1-epimerase